MNSDNNYAISTIYGLIIVSLGVVAGLAWNDAILSLFTAFLGKPESIFAKIIYAIVISLIVILILIIIKKYQ